MHFAGSMHPLTTAVACSDPGEGSALSNVRVAVVLAHDMDKLIVRVAHVFRDTTTRPSSRRTARDRSLSNGRDRIPHPGRGMQDGMGPWVNGLPGYRNGASCSKVIVVGRQWHRSAVFTAARWSECASCMGLSKGEEEVKRCIGFSGLTCRKPSAGSARTTPIRPPRYFVATSTSCLRRHPMPLHHPRLSACGTTGQSRNMR